MKTKRTILSITVFLSVFWISILIGFSYSSQKRTDKGLGAHLATDNASPHLANESDLVTLSNSTHDIASTSNRLYQSQAFASERQLDEPKALDDIVGHESSVDFADNSVLSSIQATTVVNYDFYPSKADIIQELLLNKPPSLYSDIGISIADSYVNIRNEANIESKINGKLYRNSAAKILDIVDDWYYVESGSVKGYIMRDYLKTNIPDDELIKNYGLLRISVNTDGLNVREKPEIDSRKLTVIYNNEVYPAIELYDEWIKVDITDDNTIGYVSRDYVELIVDFNKAISKEEEEELRKLKEEERIKKETEVKYRDEVDYTQDELKLLSCLVYAEAGNQSYEGKLAVANVVLNRVKSSKYPNTINDVIYQPGQFTVASSGSLAKQLDRYDSYSSKAQLLAIKAAKAALSGANNIGSRLYFNAYKSAVKKGYDKKKNCVKIEDHLFW